MASRVPMYRGADGLPSMLAMGPAQSAALKRQVDLAAELVQARYDAAIVLCRAYAVAVETYGNTATTAAIQAAEATYDDLTARYRYPYMFSKG